MTTEKIKIQPIEPVPFGDEWQYSTDGITFSPIFDGDAAWEAGGFQRMKLMTRAEFAAEYPELPMPEPIK